MKDHSLEKLLSLKILLFFALTILLFSFPRWLNGQSCLPSGITFSTQQQIDDFPNNYPNCTIILGDVCIGDCTVPSSQTNIISLDSLIQLNNIQGNLQISYADLNNLDGLDNLAKINGTTTISYNPLLISFTGLENLSSIEQELRVFGNNSLPNFEGLNNLDSIGFLHVFNSPSLINLDGLENLHYIELGLTLSNNTSLIEISALTNLNKIYGSVTISDSDSLSNLLGLANVTSINGNLSIMGNSKLINLEGLENLDSINGFIRLISNTQLQDITALENLDASTINGDIIPDDIILIGNPLLSECSIESFCSLLEDYNGSIFCSGNLPDCNSQSQIEVACATLPVEWKRHPFVTQRNGHNEITWSVSQQINNDNFIIEYRASNGDFRPIGEVTGHGTTLDEERYSFVHTNPTSGLNYYRVKQVDFEGNYSYSDVVSIRNYESKVLIIYPNPANQGVLTINSQAEAQFSIHSSDSQLIQSGEFEVGKNLIDLTKFETGIYFLNTEFGVQKIIVL